MKPARLRVAAAALAGALVATCLPADDRPVPASVLVMAQPSEGTRNGFTSEDGWHVEIGRMLTALGDVDLNDDAEGSGSCTPYSETHYETLFDFVQVEREKVGLVYGLGGCSVQYRFRGPSDDALVGVGASRADASSMAERGSDDYADQERVSLRISGTVIQGDIEKRFDWSFRRGFQISTCSEENGASLSVLELKGEAAHTLDVEVRAEELFRAGANDDAPIELARYVAADSNGDGEITASELVAVAVTPEELARWPVEGLAEEDEPEVPPTTLGSFVYQLLLPRVTRMVGGSACEAEVRGRR